MKEWNCEYCYSIQPNDLYSCKNCGAPKSKNKITERSSSIIIDLSDLDGVIPNTSELVKSICEDMGDQLRKETINTKPKFAPWWIRRIKSRKPSRETCGRGMM